MTGLLMKPISLSPSTIGNSKIISSDDSKIEVRCQMPDTFVLIDKEMHRAIHCFESVNMSRLVSEQKCLILNATLRRIMTGDDADHELLIEFISGKRFVLSTSGRIHEITAYRSGFPGAALAYAPQSIWQIPDYRIPLKMILTGRLIDRINELSAEGTQIELINLLNDKYSKMHSGANSTEIQVEIDNHHLKCLIIDFERVSLFDLNV